MNVILRNLKVLVRSSWLQILATGLLIGCLIFLANLLLLVSYNAKQTSDHIKPKLGMYFYLNQDVGEEVQGSTVMSMVEELQEAGLETSFYTKEQAFSRLSQYLPSLLEDFEEYGIDNPLPPTLYVLFSDEREYQVMKSIVVRYDGLVTNADQLTTGVSYSDQEKRIQTTINVMNVVHRGGLFLIGVILITIVGFLWYALHALLVTFKDQVIVERLLGAYNWQISLPFVFYACVIIIVGYLLFLIGSQITMSVFNGYSMSLFQQSFADLALPETGIAKILGGEFLALGITTILSSSVILRYLLRRV